MTNHTLGSRVIIIGTNFPRDTSLWLATLSAPSYISKTRTQS
jgi:hypothetical protein